MRDADRQQDEKPAHHQDETAIISGEAVELDGETDSEQERKQDESLGMERENERFGDLIGKVR